MEKVLVRILHTGRIPFIGGYGPILTPVYLDMAKVKHLQFLLGKDKIEMVGEEKPVEKQVEELPVEPVQEDVPPPTIDPEIPLDLDQEDELPAEEEDVEEPEEEEKPVVQAKSKKKKIR